jgi:HD superfamily phosphohydrolase
LERKMKQNKTMELRDPIHGPIEVTADELDVIDCPVFQRLRGIKQLGFAELVFPGAVHNRYLHCVGAMHLAGLAFDAIFVRSGILSGDRALALRQAVRLAALVHDLGHAPFSHAAEALMPMREELGLDSTFGVGSGQASHEEMSLKLLVDSPLTQAVDKALAPYGFNTLHVVSIYGDYDHLSGSDFVVQGVDYRPVLHSLVSGELDVDRMDYLLRDSYFTGVSYGKYDLDWLLSNLLVFVDDQSKGRLALDRRAIPTFEHFLLARYHMFQMVYFHPKSDIYDAMLKQWLGEVGDVARFPGSPEAYVHCNDAWLMDRLRDSNNRWADRVRDRRPLSLCLELRTVGEGSEKTAIEEKLQQAGIEGLWLKAAPVLSRYAQSPRKMARNPIYVRDRHGSSLRGYERLEEVTDLFGRYEHNQRIERLYVDKPARDAVRSMLPK